MVPMNNRFDVIIIGAGPAGIACADALAGSSLSVLLVEKNEIVGPKICAGGLTRMAFDFGIPEDKARTFHIHTVHIDGRPPCRIVLTNPLKMVDRTSLGRYHLSKVEKARNIELLTGAKLVAVDQSSIVTTKGAFRYRHLVAADGSLSPVRKHPGLPSKFGVGLYYEVPRISDDVLFHFKPGIVRSGYLWVFPHRTHTNIGICFNPDTFTAGLAKIICSSTFRKRGFSGGRPPEGGPDQPSLLRFPFRHIFLAGDAAGLASRPSGEGIHFALASGREIGRKILDPGYDMKEFRALLSLKSAGTRLFAALRERAPAAEDIPGRLLHADEVSVDAGPHGL